MKAYYNDILLAESDNTILVEGNHYFPPKSVDRSYFTESNLKTTCFWKGIASYLSIEIDGKRIENAAWYYPNPFMAASKIKDYIAFGGAGITII